MITKDEYEDLVNESYPQVELAVLGGGPVYGCGTVLRKVDPVLFDIQYHDYLLFLESEA